MRYLNHLVSIRFLPAVIFALIAVSSVPGCFLSRPPAAEPVVDVSGFWKGETRVIPCAYYNRGRCNAVNLITFDWRQTGSTLRGDYHCAIGNMVCRDANRTTYGSVVSGQVSGRNINFRLFLPGDLSSCMFDGVVDHDQASGSYNCYQGGSLQEYGIWQVKRAKPG